MSVITSKGVANACFMSNRLPCYPARRLSANFSWMLPNPQLDAPELTKKMVPPTVNMHLCAISIALNNAKSCGPPVAELGVPVTGSRSATTSSIFDKNSSRGAPLDFKDTITSRGAGTKGVDGSGLVYNSNLDGPLTTNRCTCVLNKIMPAICRSYTAASLSRAAWMSLAVFCRSPDRLARSETSKTNNIDSKVSACLIRYAGGAMIS